MSALRLSAHLAAFLVLASGASNGASETSLDTAVDVDMRSMSLLQTQKTSVKKLDLEAMFADVAIEDLRLAIEQKQNASTAWNFTTRLNTTSLVQSSTGLNFVQSGVHVGHHARAAILTDTSLLESARLNATSSVQTFKRHVESHERAATLTLSDSLLLEFDHMWHELKHMPALLEGSWHDLSTAGPVPVRTGRQLIAVFAGVILIVLTSWAFCAVGTKLYGQESLKRLRLVTACFSLSACSWGMIVANKHLMMKLQAPGIVIALQSIIGVAVAIILAGGRLSLESKQVLHWMVVPVVACVQLWTSLYTMKYMTLSILMMIRNLGPIVTLPIEMMVMPADKRPANSSASKFALLLVLASGVTYFRAEPLSWRGCALAFLNMMLAVGDNVLRRRLLTGECAEMSATMCMLLNNLVAIVPSMLLCFLSGELLEVDANAVFSSYTIAVLIISGVIGAGISYFALKVQKEIAATSFMVLQNAIHLAEVMAGVVLFQDPFTWPARFLGLTVSYCGSVWYAKVQMNNSASVGTKCKSLLTSE